MQHIVVVVVVVPSIFVLTSKTVLVFFCVETKVRNEQERRNEIVDLLVST